MAPIADTETARRVALDFYSRFDANDIEGALALMDDDLTFWIAGKPGSNATAGYRTKVEMARIFTAMTKRMKDGLRMRVKATTAEGERVALEVESHGELNDGRVYNNEYHAVMVVRGGKIAQVREYMDTQHVQSVWYTAA